MTFQNFMDQVNYLPVWTATQSSVHSEDVDGDKAGRVQAVLGPETELSLLHDGVQGSFWHLPGWSHLTTEDLGYGGLESELFGELAGEVMSTVMTSGGVCEGMRVCEEVCDAMSEEVCDNVCRGVPHTPEVLAEYYEKSAIQSSPPALSPLTALSPVEDDVFVDICATASQEEREQEELDTLSVVTMSQDGLEEETVPETESSAVETYAASHVHASLDAHATAPYHIQQNLVEQNTSGFIWGDSSFQTTEVPIPRKRRRERSQSVQDKRRRSLSVPFLQPLIDQHPALLLDLLSHPVNYEAIRSRCLLALASTWPKPVFPASAILSHHTRFDMLRVSESALFSVRQRLLKSHGQGDLFQLFSGALVPIRTAIDIVAYHWSTGVLAYIFTHAVIGGLMRIQKLYHSFERQSLERLKPSDSGNITLIPGCAVCGALRVATKPFDIELRCLLCDQTSRGESIYEAAVASIRDVMPQGPPVALRPKTILSEGEPKNRQADKRASWPMWVALLSSMGPHADWAIERRRSDWAKCRHCGFGLVSSVLKLCCFCAGSPDNQPDELKGSIAEIGRRLCNKLLKRSLELGC